MHRQYGALSGVAILLIVVNHAIHFGLQISPVRDGWLQLLVILQALGTFAVPTFLFVSGAFLSYAAGQLSLTFIRSSLGRILWPYLIWSVVFYGLEFVTSDVRYPISGYIKNLLVGYPYHFVPLLIFWYVTAPLVVRIGRRFGGLLLATIALYQAMLLPLRYPGVFGSAAAALPAWTRLLEPPVLFTPMSDWGIYFPLGLVLSMHHAAVKPRLVRLRWLAVGATAGLFLLGIANAFGVLTAPWARFAAPVPLMFLLPTIDRESVPFTRRFEILGRRSYGVYLTHFVVINVVVFLATRSGLGLGRFPVLVFPAFLVLALGLSVALMDAMARTGPGRRAYRYVFGIVPPGGV